MLGFGPLGAAPLGAIPAPALALTQDILLEVVTRFVEEGKLSRIPPELHHYTSLETAYRIISGDDIRLTHAEYSNDQTEMEEAKEIIRIRLNARSANPFFAQLFTDYQKLAPTLDVFVFCMSMGLRTSTGSSPDMLSQWRAYGQDGKGICLTLDTSHLARLVANTPGLRTNPVIYDRHTQALFVDAILDRALRAHQTGDPSVREAALAALVYATPLMKAPGFAEESEWRLIFMPPAGIALELGFHPRRDFLAPFITLNQIWFSLQPAMMTVPALAAMLGSLQAAVHVPPLVPLTKIMVGPSGHVKLNERAMLKLVAQTQIRGGVAVATSAIPYRSLA
jgi:Protein of unknown function (DUF2971)